ncbi:MAG: PEP-CTERM sorting domain-containing protein [Pirellulaceae bacterium]|nr:PEP-CTERM sorting domain-containing protein [Pirellulaceae bacterium]
MRACFCVLVGLVFLAAASSAPAEITNWYCMDDGDGAISCVADFSYDDYTMTIDGDQFWAPGHMEGWFETNTALDPTVMMWSSVENNTAFAWTGYLVNVKMGNTFVLSDPTIYVINDWTANLVQPVQVGSDWIGSVVFSGGTPIGWGETFEFSYKMSFDGSTYYQFCQEMMPVPEPGAIALLFAGALCALAVFRRK